MLHHIQCQKSNMQLVFLKRNTSKVQMQISCDLPVITGLVPFSELLMTMCIVIAHHCPSLTAKIQSTAGPNHGWNRTMKDKNVCNWYFFLTSHS